MKYSHLLTASCIATSLAFSTQAQQVWEPTPTDTGVLIIHAHPDDEGLFLGGVAPYYAQVRNLPTVLLNMVSARPNDLVEQATREQELRNAAQVYGVQSEPIFARFRDNSDLPGGYQTIDSSWDAWDGNPSDGVADTNGNGLPDGREAGALYLAEQIRRLRPSVIVTHDPLGEYGHGAHQATSLITADAYLMAADASLNIAGLDAWQADKLYMHMYEGYRNPGGVPMINNFHHDFSTPFAELGGLTASQVADQGVIQHASEGGAGLLTSFAGRRYLEEWALRFSSVGEDTTGPLWANGRFHSDIATGDFFENIDLTRFASFLADSNDDGIAGMDDYNNLIDNWGASVQAGSVMSGDADGDGIVGQGDLDLLIAGWNDSVAPPIPEPGTGFLTIALLAGGLARRRRRAMN